MAGTRSPSWRRYRLHRNHTVDEAARALGVAKGIVRRWLKVGLPYVADRKPLLILGVDLIGFLKARRAKKATCKLDECYCFSCRAPRRPAFNAVEFIPLTNTSGNLRALCEECSTVMHKRVSAAKLGALSTILDVTITEAPKHLNEIAEPCLDDHIRQEPGTDG